MSYDNWNIFVSQIKRGQVLSSEAQPNLRKKKLYIPFISCHDWAETYSISAFPAAQYYNSALSIWISVDPMVDKYPNLSPYTYCADNPVRLVDKDGIDISGVWMFYIQSTCGAGIGPTLSGNFMTGFAIDKGGITFFIAASNNHIVNQDFREGSTAINGFWGMEANVNFLGCFNWKSKSFAEAAQTQSTSIGGGEGVGASARFGKGHVGIGVGLGIGGGIDVSNMHIIESLSIAKSELTTVIYPQSSWEINDKKAIYNKEKKIIGYSGILYINTPEKGRQNTGITVQSGLDKNGNSNRQWTSLQYRENLN